MRHGREGFSQRLWCLNLDFSVQPLCSLCLRGYRNRQYNNHRDTEDTELSQRRTQTKTLLAFCVFFAPLLENLYIAAHL